jgi:L-threonylcarbamoyladenylate synthase
MIGKDVQKAADLLLSGQVVAIPTETVYGLAGNALNLRAVSEIFAVKQRPSFDPLIIHLADQQQLPTYVKVIPQPLQHLAHQFMPGPLTLLLERKAIIPDLVTAGSSLVAVRLPIHPMTRALLKILDFPLAAPSANPFGYISPTTAEHVAQQLGDKIPYILDGGPAEVGLESTIVGIEDGKVTVFRKGGLPVELIEREIGPVVVKAHSFSNPQAPGMLKSHYAPRTPFRVGVSIEAALLADRPERVGSLAFRQKSEQLPAEQQVVLSEQGDYKEAARRLFAAMRYLDQLGLDLIVAELLPEQDLGRAINDRLRRAAVQVEE